MPAIVDKFDFALTGTAASITVPMPTHTTGNLLLVFVIYDAGSITFSTATTGWTRLFNTPNGTATTCACFYKVATSSAEPDIVITHGGTNDSMTATSISIEDFNANRWVSGTAFANNYVVTTQAAATRGLMDTISTFDNNTLLIYFLGSTATTPGVHFVEDEVHELSVVDGVAEGLGTGWAFQRQQGTSSSTVYFATNATGVGVKAVVQIAPPVSGANVIPAYAVSDTSIYLNPNGGSASWEGSTQMAATAGASFGSPISGITISAPTIAFAADVGINSYHSLAGITNATTAGQISGAEVVVDSTRYNVGTRNILAHFRHPTPANNQRLSNLASNRGVWMGMRSGPTNATNYKIWQVHGSDVPLIDGYIQPLIINANNTDTIASAGTITTTDVRRYGFWTGGAGTLTQQTCIGPMWAMDTLVMAGGNAARPIGIQEIVNVAAKYKERLSSILQGANQMLCLQAIQFGNGGTNPVYLDLDATAIEFPSRKNRNKKLVNYNGIDNSIGLSYYGATGDTIIHRNSVITSENDYHWRINASSSSAATWDFTNLSLIGAGDVVLQNVTVFTGMQFTNCTTITQNSAKIQSATMTNSLLLSNNPANVVSTIFTSGGTGHAIEITTAGTYSFVGNKFNGYGSTGTTNAAIYNNSGGSVTLNVSGGGDTPTIRNGTGASTNVVNSVDFTIQNIVANTEIRIYKQSDMSELAAAEDVGNTTPGAVNLTIANDTENTGRYTATYSYNYTADTPIYVVAHSLTQQWLRSSATLKSTNGTLKIAQIPDRQYQNP